MTPTGAPPGPGRWPLGYLQTHGPHADPTTALMWGLTLLSVAVVAIIAAALIASLLRRRPTLAAGALAVDRDTGGLSWIYIGMPLTLVALFGVLVWTVDVLAQTNSPAHKPSLVLLVTGRQWWWDVAYSPDDPAQRFETANEMHIPVGEPVEVRLTGADVIHSFWVPALAGKTDTIPGRTNVTWLQAAQAGTYQGQCTEYCGAQHAHMSFSVIAEPPAVFEAWRRAQLKTATVVAAGATAGATATAPGAALFVQRCGACHTVRGTDAGGLAGPDLTHLMSRRTLAAGTLPNNDAALGGWIANPQAIKPNARMPATHLSGPELGEVRAYLETLT